MRDERLVVLRANREQSRPDQRKERNAQQRAHRHLQPPEPSHADQVNEEEEEQARKRERQMTRLRGEPTAGGRDQIIGKRIRQKSLGAYVGDDLQPRADEGQTILSQSPRNVSVFSPRLVTQRRREESRIRNRGRQDHGK